MNRGNTICQFFFNICLFVAISFFLEYLFVFSIVFLCCLNSVNLCFSFPLEVFTLGVKVERVEAIQGRWKPLTAAPHGLNDKYKKTKDRNPFFFFLRNEDCAK